jgi:predicted nucleotidyltransferase
MAPASTSPTEDAAIGASTFEEAAADELRKRLLRQPEVLFALLFGSRATGRPHPGSDWDVAVYLDEELSPRQRFRHRLQLIGELDDLGEIDLVVLNEAPALLGHRALLGQLLFARDRIAYVRYFVRTLSRSEDERYYRERDHRERLRRLEEGRFGRP